jgi:predicted phosphodiesterase
MIGIFGGDFHFRHSNPICRTDNYSDTIINKLNWLSSLKKSLNAPIISGGDIMDKDLYKSPSDVVLTLKMLTESMPDMVGIIGNHSLLYRSMEYLDKSTISVLIASGKYTHIQKYYDLYPNVRLHGFDYGTGGIQHPKQDDLIDGINVAIMHEYVSEKPNNLFGKYVAIDLLKEFSEFDFILTSDNHITFTQEYKGRILINPGSFLRMDSDQIKHKPCIFIINFETKEYYKEFVPIEDNVISTEHLDLVKDRDKRIEAFVTTMDEDYEITDSFVRNIEKYIKENKYDKEENVLINKNVEKFIYKSMEEN